MAFFRTKLNMDSATKPLVSGLWASTSPLLLDPWAWVRLKARPKIVLHGPCWLGDVGGVTRGVVQRDHKVGRLVMVRLTVQCHYAMVVGRLVMVRVTVQCHCAMDRPYMMGDLVEKYARGMMSTVTTPWWSHRRRRATLMRFCIKDLNYFLPDYACSLCVSTKSFSTLGN